MKQKNNLADTIYSLMLMADAEAVSQTSLKVMNVLENSGVQLQILGIATALLTILDRYGLNYTDVLGMAECIVFSGRNNNMLQGFKELQLLMQAKKEILN